jgi:hypothetical protein
MSIAGIDALAGTPERRTPEPGASDCAMSTSTSRSTSKSGVAGSGASAHSGSKAATISSGRAKRWAGSSARQRIKTASSSSVTSVRACDGGTNTSIGERAVSRLYSSAPTPNTSERMSAALPCLISGAR